jgi:hypothetical protein
VSPYSPERRTALVLCGTGAHGVYHAGVMRALQEAGVKIDLFAGHGVGAAGAALGAIDGGARLWDANGVWRSPVVARLYSWKKLLRAVTLATAAVAAALLVALLAVAFGFILPRSWVIGFLILLGLGVLAAMALQRRTPSRRRTEGAGWWHLAGAPMDADGARQLFGTAIWELIRGVAPIEQPSRIALGRRYSEVLQENIGQPGFGDLVVVATDLDSRRDLVAALLREPFRSEFIAPRPDRDRRSEVLDLAGVGRDHALDVIAGALTPPVTCEPELVTFAADSFWRGETHRVCDRPGAVNRLLEEVAAAGATQAIVVSAVAPAPGPHRLRATRIDMRGRLGEFQSAAEAASLRDALEMARLRFDSIYLVCPAHNPVGPFDFTGAYDEASDRRQDLHELMERAYEDAYRQFIEPVVGASGEHLARVDATGTSADDYQRIFDDADTAG